MILKLAHGKKMHVYDLKPNQSLSDVKLIIKELFKKLPTQFTIHYIDQDGQAVILQDNETFDKLIIAIKDDVKVLKLYIDGVGSQILHQTKSQQKVQTGTVNINHLNELTQNITINNSEHSQGIHEITNQIDEMSQRFNNDGKEHLIYNELDNKEKKIQMIQLEALEAQQTQKKQTNKQSEQKIQCFQHIDQQRLQSKRQINFNDQEYLSDPDVLRKFEEEKSVCAKQRKQSLHSSLNKKQEQNFSQQSGSNPRIWEIAQKIEQQKKNIKPSSQQKIQPQISQKLNRQQAQVLKGQQEDNFSIHQAKCDICNMFPIIGIRYKCVLCQQYDLCQKCQNKFSHQHPLLKICYTYQTPISIKVEIPQFSQKPVPQIKKESIRLQQLTGDQRRERILSLSSEISEMLDLEIKDVHTFIVRNEKYTKQTLIELLLDRRINPAKYAQKQLANKNNCQNDGLFGINKVIGNLNSFKNKLLGNIYQHKQQPKLLLRQYPME